jgi:Thioredoxin like C-terminal domain
MRRAAQSWVKFTAIGCQQTFQSRECRARARQAAASSLPRPPRTLTSPGGHHGVPARDLSRAGNLVTAGLSVAILLPRSRQGRPLRRLGAAAALRRGTKCGVQVAAPAREGPTRLHRIGLGPASAIGPEAAALDGATGRIVYHFQARDLNLIMGPASRGTPIRFRVRIDGEAPGDAHGIDVDHQGYGTVSEPRMYQLIRQPEPIAHRVFDIEFVGPGVDVFDFTFG